MAWYNNIENEVCSMYRMMEEDLKKWKNDKFHKPLIISGARQTGKTYSILEFVKKQYASYIYINFERDLDIKSIFDQIARPDEIIMYLQTRFPEVDFSLDIAIILDEIQACPQALTTIKFLGSETPHDYIISGSLLGVAIHHTSSYPVGYVQSLIMRPMNFKEFLYANHINDKQIEYLKECFDQGKPVMESIHQIYMDLFKKYIICGGMPEVVKTYCETKDFIKVQNIQHQIVEDYYRDMAKYAEYSDKIKVHDCFISIPEQLSKENKKFQYKLVREGGNAKIFESSLQWLLDSGIIQKCTRLKAIDQPLRAYRETSIFKVYMGDTGLLVSMFGIDSANKILTGNLGIYKGAIYENITAQALSEHHELYYFEPSAHNEIDFILNTNDGAIPIEVKSAGNTKSKSLKAYIEKYHPVYAYRFSSNNVNTQDPIIKNYPLYMLMFI